MKEFEKLNIIDDIIKVIKEEDFKFPTLIQKKTIPKLLAGGDVIATSATGSGKTLAFASRVIELCDPNLKNIQAIVITPTRELAKQVGADISKFSKFVGLNIVNVYGGQSIDKEIESLKNAQIVVCTTGRLIDHIDRKTINLENIQALVLDEVDLMLEKEFLLDIEKILGVVPNYIQKMFFSATITEEMLKLASKYMNEPSKIKAEFVVDEKKLLQSYFQIEKNEKLSLLIHLLKYQSSGLNLVFVNRHETAEFIKKNVSKFTDLKTRCVHGAIDESKRNKIISDFRDEKFDVLITTDIAARGIDIPNISHIYNYNVPKDKVKYVHRIGRTARAGAEGLVINFVAGKDMDNFTKIIGEYFKNMKFKRLPDYEKIEPKFKEKESQKVIKVGNKKFYR
ncbi:MAG: DEAD/DEAH box helicase [Candidatus Woesearchaeota archaeon]|jgi:ATP-dependent RNA helicase DeaD|nr:DEAD/DEAH box helicase [Candidatus Woesearchaeota archaeon]